MDEKDLNAFKQSLIDKYSGTFAPETEEALREFRKQEIDSENKDYAKYCTVAANCAIYMLQKTQEVSTNVFEFFRRCTYHKYVDQANTLEFRVEYGDILRKVKASILDLLETIIPDTYIQLGFSGVAIDQSAIIVLEIPAFFANNNSSHLAMPALLNRCSLDFFEWTIAHIDEGTIEDDSITREMIVKMSAILIVSHGIYNMLFNYDAYRR